METHSNFRETGGVQSMGSQRVGHNSVTKKQTKVYMHKYTNNHIIYVIYIYFYIYMCYIMSFNSYNYNTTKLFIYYHGNDNII